MQNNKTSKLAILSFLLALSEPLYFRLSNSINYSLPLSIANLLNLLGGIALLAILTGVAAIIRIEKKELKGKWLAVLGVIIGSISLSIFIYLIVVDPGLWRS